MAKPIDRDVMLGMARNGAYTPYALVKFKGREHVIWKDRDGPIYSTVCGPDSPERVLAASRNTVYWDNGLDTATNRVQGTPWGNYSPTQATS